MNKLSRAEIVTKIVTEINRSYPENDAETEYKRILKLLMS